MSLMQDIHITKKDGVYVVYTTNSDSSNNIGINEKLLANDFNVIQDYNLVMHYLNDLQGRAVYPDEGDTCCYYNLDDYGNKCECTCSNGPCADTEYNCCA